MDEERNENIEVNRGDVLALTLCQSFCSWVGAEPMDYQHWVNQLLPMEKDDKIVKQVGPVEIECNCLIQAAINKLEKQYDEIDAHLGTVLGEQIKVLKLFTFVNASRHRGMKDGETVWWAIRRQNNLAWFIEKPINEIRGLF